MSLMPVVALSRDSNPLKMPSSSIQGLKAGDLTPWFMGSEHIFIRAEPGEDVKVS